MCSDELTALTRLRLAESCVAMIEGDGRSAVVEADPIPHDETTPLKERLELDA